MNKENKSLLKKLQADMQQFYTTSNSYYSDIDFTQSIWKNEESLPHQAIITEIFTRRKVLEVGCGRANILRSGVIKPAVYTGLDFSAFLMEQNQKEYPEAYFEVIRDPQKLPFENSSFDLVFSTYVLEHVIFPHIFLSECSRVLKPGGLLIILCPDFLSNSRISSQRVGLSQGTGREKLKKGKLLDALITFWDSKVKMPAQAQKLRRLAEQQPQFYINTQPTCFVDSFLPDVDAVYLTYAPEIKRYLAEQIKWQENAVAMQQYCQQNRLIYLSGIKKFN